MVVAGSLSPGAGSARYVRKSVSGGERSSITTKKRTAEPHPQLKKMPYHANSVAVPVWLGTDTVRNALNVARR